MSELDFLASFEYLRYGSTTIIIFLISFSAGIDFRRQNLTFIDVRFSPRAKKINRSDFSRSTNSQT